MFMYHACAWYPYRPKDDIISPGTRVAGDHELANGYWESKLGPLQEWPVLLTTGLSFYLGSKNMVTGGTF